MAARAAASAAAAADAAGPIGSITMWSTATAPTGWLLCDGSSKLIADYPNLSGVIRATWGGVDGTHFYLPDMQSRAPVGKGLLPITTDEGQASEINRNISHTHTQPNHSHNVPNHQHAAGSLATADHGTANRTTTGSPTTTGTAHNITGSTANDGGGVESGNGGNDATGGQAAQSIFPFLALAFIIKT